MIIPSVNFLAILPQTIVLATALLVLLVDAFTRDNRVDHRVLPWVSLAGLLAAAVAAVWLFSGGHPQPFQLMAVADGYSLALMLVILLAAAFGVLLAQATIPSISSQAGAYYALLLLSVVGMMFMGAAQDLLVVFLALEILSLAMYILAGFNREEPRGAEAALKYFLLGAFASGFFLYGVALIYAATATTNLPAIADALGGAAAVATGAGQQMYLLAGVALLLVGLGFKIALVPFHMWTPDAYQGAPTPVTAFMSTGTKTAAFAALMRVFVLALPAAQPRWGWAMAVLAVLTMTLGNLAALRQTSLKRLLAYSSIAHAGYMLVGLAPGVSDGVAAVMFYLFSYVLMNAGVFAVVILLERREENDVLTNRLAGLSNRRPLLAVALSIFLFSLAGIPPFAGFFAKFFVFSAAMRGGWGWLALVGVLNSVISAFYYLYLIVQMFFRNPEEEQAAALASVRGKKAKQALAAMTVDDGDAKPALALQRGSLLAVVILAVLGVIAAGVWPGPVLQWLVR